MDKQIKSSKVSKILIITSIATGVTLSSAYLIYKHKKDNKQFKRNSSHSNFSITIHLSKDNLNQADSEEEIKNKGKELIEDDEEISEIRDFNDYVSHLPNSEEKNFFLNLFDKFINIFTKKEDLLDDTIIITKPNEALTTLDDTVELDDNNDTLIITKPNEAPSPIEGNKENLKILNEVIEQTINLVNSGDSSDSTGSGTIRKKYSQKILTSSPKSPTGSKEFIIGSEEEESIHSGNSNIANPLSTRSSTMTIIGKHEISGDLQNSTFDNSINMKTSMPEVDFIDDDVTGDEGDSEGEMDTDQEEFTKIISSPSQTKNDKKIKNRKRNTTITSFNTLKNEELIIDSENENVTPSTPKMGFVDRRNFSPEITMTKLPKTDNESINPLSVDINDLLVTKGFEFSDEEEGGNTTTDTIEIIKSKGKTLHRASSISSTSTFQSAKSSWTDGQSLMEENVRNEIKDSRENKDNLINDETWEVNSVCSSTSGFYSAQEDFFDANGE